MSRRDALGLFRQALRASRKLESPLIRSKFRYNARDIIDFYAGLGDDRLSAEMLQRGWGVLATFERLFDGPPAVVDALFAPFGVEAPRRGAHAAGEEAVPPAAAGRTDLIDVV